jgi:hypothetical protein
MQKFRAGVDYRRDLLGNPREIRRQERRRDTDPAHGELDGTARGDPDGFGVTALLP